MPTDSAPPGGGSFDPRDLLFNDAHDDPASGWGVGNITGGDGTYVGTIAYTDSALQLDVASDGGWLWTRRDNGEVSGTLRLAGEFAWSGQGQFGLLCASGEDQLYGVLISSDGGWWFVNVTDEGAVALAEKPDAGLPVTSSDTLVVALECAGLASGSFRMQAWLGGMGPIGMYSSDEGPQSFDRSGVYVEADSDGYSVRVEQALGFGVTGADGQMNAEGQALMGHIPSDWQGDCYQSPVPPIYGAMASTNVVCFIGSPGDPGAEVVEYAQYASKADMDEAYQQRVDNFGSGSGADSCRNGSREALYTIGGADAGRVLCIEQQVGIRFDWTDDRLNILSQLVDYDGDYPSTYEDWNIGGPNL